MDAETGQVLAVAVGSLGATAVFVDYVLKLAISILTIWYLWRKIHSKKKEQENDEDTVE